MYADGKVTLDDADYRYTDCNGEQYWFKDDRLALNRVVRKLKSAFDHLHPADSIGEIGAAIETVHIGPGFCRREEGICSRQRRGQRSRQRCVVPFLATTRGTQGRHAAPIYRERGFAMSNEVYANGNEVSCKAGAGKSIAAFPDVCFTPPHKKATPPGVPIPYPNTGMASDASDGSKTVKD